MAKAAQGNDRDPAGGSTVSGSGRAADGSTDVLRAVERFAMVMSESGMPRMSARIFAYALAEDADRYTASEFARALQVSPASVSTALPYLVNARLLFKEREPGRRSDVYRVYDDDVWSAILTSEVEALSRWDEALDEAIGWLPEGRGRQRLQETQEFFRFMDAEMPALIHRWAKQRKNL